jgi:hypothetical protein
MRRRRITPMNVFLAVSAVVIWIGWKYPTERFITPESGLGYALGIAGGSLMLLLLLYPARKRVRWLSFIGTVKRWFQVHMVLGIVGPILVLFHANFRLGATNSNVALVCMIVVSVSGLVGRYFYRKIHHGLYGRKATLAELKENAARLQHVSSTIPFLPELAQRLDQEESWLLARSARSPYVVRPLLAALLGVGARWRLHRYIRRAIRASVAAAPVLAAQKRRLRVTARDFAARRLRAARSVAEFESYERLFSLWHVLHLPLFFMLLIAGIVHVISVHVY